MPNLSAKRLTLNAKHGFTLIEFLVVLALLTISVGSSLLFLTNLIKGSNKANIVAETRQNGQTVMGSLERMIRNASLAENVLGQTNYLKLTIDEAGNRSYLFIKGCVVNNGTYGPNSWIGVGQNATGAPPADTSLIPVTNTDPISGVDISGCDFNVVSASEGSNSPALVNIRFFVSQGAVAPSRQDYLAKLEFKTTISLRKY